MRERRIIASIFVIVFAATAALLAGVWGDDSGHDATRVQWLGVVAVLAGAAVAVLGWQSWARAALTLAGTLAGLATIVSGRPLSDGPAAFLLAVLFLGLSAAIVQASVGRASSALAALAAGAPIAHVLENGYVVLLVGLAASAGVLWEALAPDGPGPIAEPEDGEAAPGPRGEVAFTEPSVDLAADLAADAGPSDAGPADDNNDRLLDEAEVALDQREQREPVDQIDEPEPIETAAVDPEPVEAAAMAPPPPSHRDRRPAPGNGAESPDYLTIGRMPKLPRTTDLLPPVIELSAPAGHQFDGFAQQGLVIRGASHVGTLHMQQRRVRQDSYAVSATEDGSLIVAAVADGLGSERLSSMGAEWATASAVGVGIEGYERSGQAPRAEDLVQQAAIEVQRRASQLVADGETTAFSTTLIVAVLSCESYQGELARVGDSRAFTRTETGWQAHFSDLNEAPDAPTNAIPNAAPVIESMPLVLGPGQCLLMVTDGIGDLMTHAPDVREELFENLAAPMSPLQFSAVAGFQRRQAHDDQTALGIWRVEHDVDGSAAAAPAARSGG